LKRQLGTTPKLHDNFVAASSHDEALDLYLFGGHERAKSHQKETKGCAPTQSLQE
jgi:hypothetical protein